MSPRRAAGLAFVGIGLVATMMLASPFPSTAGFRWAELAALSAVGLVGWLLTVLRPVSPSTGSVLAVVMVVLVSTVSAAASPHPSLAFPAAWHTAMMGGVGLLAWRWVSSASGRRDAVVLLGLLATLVIGSVLAAVLQAWLRAVSVGLNPFALALRPGGSGGMVGAATWAADYTVLLVPLLAGAVASGGPRRYPAAAGILGIGALVLLISATRSLWLATAAVALAALVVYWLRGSRRRIPWKPILVIAPLLVVILVAFWPRVAARLGQDADEGRADAFRAAVSIAADRPILGGGPGTYPLLRLGYPAAYLPYYVLPNSEDVPLTTAAETGLIGIAALVLAGLLVARSFRREWLSSPKARPVVIGGACGLAAILLHSLVDVVIDLPGLAVLAFVAAGIAGAGTRATSPKTVRVLASAGLVAALLVLPGVARTETAVSAYEASLSAWDRGDPGAAASLAAGATVTSPDFAPAWLVLARARDATGDLPGAIAAQLRLLELEALPQHLVSLALLYDANGQGREAQTAINEALAAQPNDPFIILNSAIVLAGRVDQRTTVGYLTRLIRLERFVPLQAADLPSSMRPLLAEAVSSVKAALAAEGDRWGAIQVALASGDVAWARTLPDTELESAVVAAWAGDEAARRSVERTALDGDPSAASWAWILAGRACDAPGVRRWESLLTAQVGWLPYIPVSISPVDRTSWDMLPLSYPRAIWHLEAPTKPHVDGTWVIVPGGSWACGGSAPGG